MELETAKELAEELFLMTKSGSLVWVKDQDTRRYVSEYQDFDLELSNKINHLRINDKYYTGMEVAKLQDAILGRYL